MAEGEIEDVPFEPVEEKLDYIDELTGLSEPTGAMTFSSSSAIITIRDPVMHGMGRAIAVFILFICMFGFLNGLDYASPESGLIRPDEFVYRMSMGAPDESAVFQGMIYDDEGEPLANATIHISWDNGMTWKSNETLSDENGHFYLEHLDPGLARVDIIVERDGYRDVLANRVILSPPAMIEPIGFTKIDFIVPSQSDFAAQPCSNNQSDCEIRTIDLTPDQMAHPLMDLSAAGTYIMIGFAFLGLSIIAAGFALWSLKSGSVAVLRTSATLAFFTMGHYYSACLFGLVAFALTFAIPKRTIPLTD
jgi:hypothetical protein